MISCKLLDEANDGVADFTTSSTEERVLQISERDLSKFDVLWQHLTLEPKSKQ